MAPKRSRETRSSVTESNTQSVPTEPTNDDDLLLIDQLTDNSNRQTPSPNPQGKRARPNMSFAQLLESPAISPGQMTSHSNGFLNSSSSSLDQREADLETREKLLAARESAVASNEIMIRQKQRELDRSINDFELHRLNLLTELEQMKASQTRQQSEILLSLAQLTTKKAELERTQRDLLVEQAQFDLRVAEDLRKNAQLSRDVAERLRRSAEMAQMQLDVVKATQKQTPQLQVTLSQMPALVSISRPAAVSLPQPPFVEPTHRDGAPASPQPSQNSVISSQIAPPRSPVAPNAQLSAPTAAIASPAHLPTPVANSATIAPPSVSAPVVSSHHINPPANAPLLSATNIAAPTIPTKRIEKLVQPIEASRPQPVEPIFFMDLSEDSPEHTSAPSTSMPGLEALPALEEVFEKRHVGEERLVHPPLGQTTQSATAPTVQKTLPLVASPALLPSLAAPVGGAAITTLNTARHPKTSSTIAHFMDTPIVMQSIEPPAIEQSSTPPSIEQPKSPLVTSLGTQIPQEIDQPISLTSNQSDKPTTPQIEAALATIAAQADTPAALSKCLANLYKIGAVEPPLWDNMCRPAVWEILISFMQSHCHPQQSVLWAECLRLLVEIARVASPKEFQSILDAGLHSLAVRALQDHQSNIECQRCACTLLCLESATLDNTARDEFAQVLVNQGCIPLLAEDVRRFVKVPITQAAVVELLADIASAGFVQPIAQTGVIKLLIQAIKQHRYSRELNQAGCRLLLSLFSQDPQLVGPIVAADGVKAILGSLRSHVVEQKMMENALRIFCLIASSNDENSKRILVNSHRSGLISCIIKTMNRHEHDVAVQRYGCELIAQVAANNDSVKRDVSAASGLTVIEAALAKPEWKSHQELQEWAKRALQILPRSPHN